MTFREKLQIEQPSRTGDMYIGGCSGCPSDYQHPYRPYRPCGGADEERCAACWDEEIPDETITIEIKKEDKPMKTAVVEALRDRIRDLISREDVEDAVVEAIGANDFDYYIELAMDDVLGNLDERLGEAAREMAGEIIDEMVNEVLDI